MYYEYIKVPEKYIGLIIGKKGKTIKRIEIKFSVKIVSVDALFLIYSPNNKENILKSKNYISTIINKKFLKENECPICLEKIDFEKDFVTTQCKHRFHFSCLQKSLKNNNCCPVCRETLCEKKDIEKIIEKTLMYMRTTNYNFYSYPYTQDIYSYSAIIEEFLKEPLRYALSEII